jgi:hypothetical protein
MKMLIILYILLCVQISPAQEANSKFLKDIELASIKQKEERQRLKTKLKKQYELIEVNALSLVIKCLEKSVIEAGATKLNDLEEIFGEVATKGYNDDNFTLEIPLIKSVYKEIANGSSNSYAPPAIPSKVSNWYLVCKLNAKKTVVSFSLDYRL